MKHKEFTDIVLNTPKFAPFFRVVADAANGPVNNGIQIGDELQFDTENHGFFTTKNNEKVSQVWYGSSGLEFVEYRKIS